MQISWWTLVIQGLNFLVLVWLLQRFLYRPVQDVIERRKREGLKAEELAKQAKREADALKARYELALAGIEDERKAAMHKATTAIEAERNRIIDEATRSAAESLEKARVEIERDKAAACDALRADVVELAGKTAAAMLAGIAPSIPDEVVLARLENELKRLDASERRRLQSELTASPTGLEIMTAQPLTPEQEKRWKARIEQVLDSHFDIVFSHDPSLISGAVLSLPHTLIRATWSAQLERAKATLLRGGNADLS